MTAEAPKASKRPRNAYPEEVRLAAFNLWLENGKPDWRLLQLLLKDKIGKDINFTTLHDWSTKMPEWKKAVADTERKSPAAILAALDAAKADANTLEADHFVGIKANLVGRLYLSMQDMQLTGIADWVMALDCLEKIEAHIHAERGKAVAEKGPNVVSSLMERLSPNVSIAPFKKPAAPGAN